MSIKQLHKGYCPACDKEFRFEEMGNKGFCPECGYRFLPAGSETVTIDNSREYKVVTLCGSTRFKDAFVEMQKQLTLAGYIVISVGLFGHSGDFEALNEETKQMLDDMHKRKIDMADEVFVINVGGYVGESTKSEIDYAKKQGKTIRYLCTCNTCQHFIGMGDWDLCCSLSHEGYPCGFLCYEDTPACEKYLKK